MFQPVNVTGFDGNSCLRQSGTGFSDDEGSLSPPRHTYILEQCGGPRGYLPRGEPTYSDDELAGFNSSDDAIAYASDFAPVRGPYRSRTHTPAARQHRYRSDHPQHSHTIYASHSQHCCPDAL